MSSYHVRTCLFFVFVMTFFSNIFGQGQDRCLSYLQINTSSFKKADKKIEKISDLILLKKYSRATKLYMKVRSQLGYEHLSDVSFSLYPVATPLSVKDIIFEDILNDSVSCFVCCLDSTHEYCPLSISSIHELNNSDDSKRINNKVLEICKTFSDDTLFVIFQSFFNDDQKIRKELGSIYDFSTPPNTEVKEVLKRMRTSDSVRYEKIQSIINTYGIPENDYLKWLYSFLLVHTSISTEKELLFMGDLSKSGISNWYRFEYLITRVILDLKKNETFIMPVETLTCDSHEFVQSIELFITRMFLDKKILNKYSINVIIPTQLNLQKKFAKNDINIIHKNEHPRIEILKK